MDGNLPLPKMKQREVLYMPERGHAVVLGTAGSGKTTLALYRAAYLSAENMPHMGNVLLLTFNRALVTYLNYLKPTELNRVAVENYHTFARGYLNYRGKMSYNAICDDKSPFIHRAISVVEEGYKPSKFFKRHIDFFVDEIDWLESNGIKSLDEYISVERVGRVGTNLSKKLRPVMFEIYEKYLRLRQEGGFLYDWDDIACRVKEEFEQDDTARRYRHIVIDEGQDFSPEMLRSLAAAIPEDGSLTFFGDVAQQIYGQRMSWRAAGLDIAQQWMFEDNYRNTKQIARLAHKISEMPYFSGILDLVEPSSPSAAGPKPTLGKCKNHEDQIETAISLALDTGTSQSVAILVKNREQEAPFSNQLGCKATRLHKKLQHWQEGPGIYHGTYHSAKGLEFDTVILPFLDDDNFPDASALETLGEEEALTRAGRLLYVAITRAKTRLVILYCGQQTRLLPEEGSLYQEVLV